MGTPAYATTILKALINDPQMNVSLLVTQEDKPVGRKQVLTPPDTKVYVNENALHVKVYQPKALRSEEAYITIVNEKPDFIVVAAYGQILPKAILEIAPCINLHASLLPKYRGASPIQTTILEGDTYAGVTSMLMEEGLDTGAMLGWRYVPTCQYTSGELFTILAEAAADLTLKTLKYFYSIQALTQVSAEASHCRKIRKEDGAIDFEQQSACEIIIRSRAFTPWPGVFLPSGMKLHQIAKSTVHSDAFPGTIVAIGKESITISCKEGCLEIMTLQPASKKVMNAREYILGKRLSVGNTLA